MEQKKPSELVPGPYGDLFAMYDSFNSVQSSLLEELLYTDNSIVLSAPTGAGKTVAFELAIARMLQEGNNMLNNNNILPKAIYIAPVKTLCNERFEDWEPRFKKLSITCANATGDIPNVNLSSIRVVISTPEKWYSLIKSGSNFKQILKAVQLFIVDEVQLLNEDTRGPILETIVASMKSYGVKRFLVASATIPNIEDLTSWIGSRNYNVTQRVFDETHRPVPLEIHVQTISKKSNGFKFDESLNCELPSVIDNYAKGKSTLIFCNTRGSTKKAALDLKGINFVFQLTEEQKLYLSQLKERLINENLKEVVENGIAFHHAGLEYADRREIESGFREGYIKILLCTSTLAMGVNLPAYLVIIKSTQQYREGYVEYPEHMLLQMIGRAGRRQYDTRGVAVILTQSKNVQKYKNLINGTAPIESHLYEHLNKYLKTEIALNSISISDSMDWIRSTYLYVRSMRNPTGYKFSTSDDAKCKLEKLCREQFIEMENAGLITINEKEKVQTTPIGKLMGEHSLSFKTMERFRNLEGNKTLEEIFNLIVDCEEFNEYAPRRNEKKVLNSLKKAIRFPIKELIQSWQHKVSCIIQAVLGKIEIPDENLKKQSNNILRVGKKVSKCLLEYMQLMGSENSCFKTLLHSYIAEKCFRLKMWENSNPTDDEALDTSIPKYRIKLTRVSTDYVAVYAEQINESYVNKGDANAVLIIGDSLNNILKYYKNFNQDSWEFNGIKIQNPNVVEYIYAHIVHTKYVGFDANDTLEINAPKIEESKKESKGKKSEKSKRTSNKRNCLTETSNAQTKITRFFPKRKTLPPPDKANQSSTSFNTSSCSKKAIVTEGLPRNDSINQSTAVATTADLPMDSEELDNLNNGNQVSSKDSAHQESNQSRNIEQKKRNSEKEIKVCMLKRTSFNTPRHDEMNNQTIANPTDENFIVSTVINNMGQSSNTSTIIDLTMEPEGMDNLNNGSQVSSKDSAHQESNQSRNIEQKKWNSEKEIPAFTMNNQTIANPTDENLIVPGQSSNTSIIIDLTKEPEEMDNLNNGCQVSSKDSAHQESNQSKNIERKKNRKRQSNETESQPSTKKQRY